MRIIVCDDYLLIVSALIRDIKRIEPQAECEGFFDAAEALEYIRTNQIDIALLDIDMPEINGLTLGKEILDLYPRANIIFVTGHPEYALEAHELYASSFLVKPVTFDALKNAFEHLRNPVAELDEETVAGFYHGKSNLGQNIRNLRIKHGLSVPQLAEKLNVTVQTVYRWENGERTPDIVKFIMLADLLGVEIHELLS